MLGSGVRLAPFATSSTLQKMFRTMVMMNEADVVYNQAQRQSRISFYMTQLGEEAAGVGSAAAI